MSNNRLIIIAPTSKSYQNDKLFTDPALNRDDCLAPLIRMKEKARSLGYEIHTDDYLTKSDCGKFKNVDYYSFGIIPDFKLYHNINFRAYFCMEPPVVKPGDYQRLPTLSHQFEKIYLHNVCGEGYNLKNLDKTKLKKLYWPQPWNYVLEPFWSNNKRKKKLVIINGKHIPHNKKGELYSKRLEALAGLSKFNLIDLYGRGWDKWLNRSSIWWPNIKNYFNIKQVYQGACDSKYQVLSQYQFCLCFENMKMQGYITEKIFDCFYAGTIPIYLGAPDIEKYIPKEAFIDFRKFESYDELKDFLLNLSDEAINNMKDAGKCFIESPKFFDKFYNSLENIIL